MFLVPSNKRSILNSTLSLVQQQQQQQYHHHHQSPHLSATATNLPDSSNREISHILNHQNNETHSSSSTRLESFKRILELLIKSSTTIFCKFSLNSFWTLKKWAKLSLGVLVEILNPTSSICRHQTTIVTTTTTRLPLAITNFAFETSPPSLYSASNITRKATSLATNCSVIGSEAKTVNPASSESLSSECNYSLFYNKTNSSGTRDNQRSSRNRHSFDNNNFHQEQLSNLEYHEGMDLCRRKIAQRKSSLDNSINSSSSTTNNNNNSMSGGGGCSSSNDGANISNRNNHVDPNSAAACFWRLHSMPLSNGASAVRLHDDGDGEEAPGNSWNKHGNSFEGHNQRHNQLLRRDIKQAAQTPSAQHFQGQQNRLSLQIESLSCEPEIVERLYKYDLLLNSNRQSLGHQSKQQQQQHQQQQEAFFKQQRQQARIVDKHDLHLHQPPKEYDSNFKNFNGKNSGNKNNITTNSPSPSSTLLMSSFVSSNQKTARQQHQQQQPQKLTQSYNQHPIVGTKQNVTTLEGVGRSLDANDGGNCLVGITTRVVGNNHNSNREQSNELQDESGLVVVSKRALSNITDQIAFSMSRMKDLEERVRVIPELQRKLDHVMSDVASSTTSLQTTPIKHQQHHNQQQNQQQQQQQQQQQHNQQHLSQPLDCGCQSFREHLRYNYNSISREQRLNHYMKSQTLSSTTNNSLNGLNNHITTTYNHLISPLRTYQPVQLQSSSKKVDASTNTELSMSDVVTRLEVDTLVATMQKTYSSLSSSSRITSRNHLQLGVINNNRIIREDNKRIFVKGIVRKSSSSSQSETSTSDSMSGPKSSSPVYSRSDSCEDDARVGGDDDEDDDGHGDGDGEELEGEMKSECYSNKCIIDETEDLESQLSDRVDKICDEDGVEKINGKIADGNDNQEHLYDNNISHERKNDNNNDDDDDDDEDEDELEEDTAENWLNGEEPYSLGSSYQDPSDFEEYCAYGESLERRTKDFMSHSTKIPNDLRFALIRLNDFIRRNRSFDQIETSSSCIEVIRKEWFEVTASKDSQALKTKLYVDYFESFTKQLLNTVVNLTDSAGNTAMHYAASHYKLDIIKVLLETKVCDVNCRNRAGYTPIMLLALAEIDSFNEKEIARRLFNLGDVNIKARTSGQTALMLAASHGRFETCKLLLECGADPSMQDYDGSTALMCGSEIGNEEVVKCLLAHKLTDPTAIDNDGLDALTIAMNNGHKSIGLMLYAAKNVPRMNRFAINNGNSTNINQQFNTSLSYLGASLRRSRGKLATNYVRRADSLLGSRSARATIKH